MTDNRLVLSDKRVSSSSDCFHQEQLPIEIPVPCLSAKYHTHTTLQSQSVDDEVVWRLPGWGKSQPDCGEFLKAVSCPSHGTEGKHDRFITLKHCYDPECPICYESWAVREGNRASERFNQGHKLYLEAGQDLQDERHFTFSPPQSWAIDLIKTKVGYKKLKSQAIKEIKKAGLQGGCLVFHSHRVNKDKVLYLSPHFHVVGYGYLEGSKEFYSKTGWIYKNMGKRNTIAGTIIYVLDHCGLAYVNDERVFHALTWFGCMGYNKIKKESEVKREISLQCCGCGAYVKEYSLKVSEDGYGLYPDWTLSKGDYRVKLCTITYGLAKIRKKGRDNHV